MSGVLGSLKGLVSDQLAPVKLMFTGNSVSGRVSGVGRRRDNTTRRPPGWKVEASRALLPAHFDNVYLGPFFSEKTGIVARAEQLLTVLGATKPPAISMFAE